MSLQSVIREYPDSTHIESSLVPVCVELQTAHTYMARCDILPVLISTSCQSTMLATIHLTKWAMIYGWVQYQCTPFTLLGRLEL